MRLDSHQHFWRYRPEEYPWITDRLASLRRDFLPNDLRPLLDGAGIDGSIAVQACQTLAETRWLLQLADESPWVHGVVGWVDLQSPDVDGQLADLARHPKLVGVRHVVQDEPDDRFLLRPDFLRGVARLPTYRLVYDILIYPRQLPAALEFVRRFPEQPFVLDHCAKPAVRDGALSPWRDQVRELAAFPNVACKVSGLVTEARRDDWRPDDFRRYLDVVFEAFSPDRLLFGSDWPVCLLAAPYEQVYDIIDHYAAALGPGARAGLFGGNAASVYNIPR